MAGEILVSEEIYTELSSIFTVVTYLETAFEAAREALLLIEDGDIYKGKAKEEMHLFYQLAYEHIQSLILLYSNALKYAGDIIAEMIVKDMEIALAMKD